MGKNISALKGKTVLGKPTVVASERIKITKDIDILKKKVFLPLVLSLLEGYGSSYP